MVVTKKQLQDIPTLTEKAPSGGVDLAEDNDDLAPDYIRGNLLSDRYLIPLGIVLAALLVWIMMPGDSDIVATEGIENSEVVEPTGSRDPFAEMVLDDEDIEQIKDQDNISVGSPAAQDALGQMARQPALKREFPVDGARNGEQLVYQLGVYSRLTSAEKVQQDLTRHGLFARIDKRAGHDGIQYSVLLGPYQDPGEDARVVATLKRENVSYYSKMTGSAL